LFDDTPRFEQAAEDFPVEQFVGIQPELKH